MKCDKLQRYSLDVDYEENAIAVPDDKGTYMDASDVDAVLAEKDEEILQLKKKLEDAKATAYTESVDAGMENRKLKRALYKACANWAHIAVAFFSSYVTKNRWRKMERKCIKKAEEYK